MLGRCATVVLAFVVVQAAFVGSPAAVAGESGSVGEASAPEAGSPLGKVWAADPRPDVRGKISESLRGTPGDPRGFVNVVIHTADVPSLARALATLGATRIGRIDEGPEAAGWTPRPWGAVDRPTTVFARVPSSALDAIASVPGVVFVDAPELLSPLPVDDPVVREERAALQRLRERQHDGAKGPGPTSSEPPGAAPTGWAVSREHRAWDVWQLGYEGGGVNVASFSTGVDFGHPGLQGRYAVVTDPASPWYGWPIMVHLSSMEALMGEAWWTSASDLTRLPVPFWLSVNDGDSWYTNTDYAAIDVDGDGYLVYADLTINPETGLTQRTPRANPQQYGNWGANWNTRVNRNYFIGLGPSQIPSVSGVYRLGVHRDDTLTGLWGEKVGVLVADSTTAGIYDTVYVDLNFDFNFTNDKRLTKSDPVAVADLTGDGVADVSGGVLYYIARSTAVTGEVAIPAIAGGETQAALTKRWDLDADGTPESASVAVDIDGQFSFRPPTRLWLDDGAARYYLPGATEVVYEEYTASGSDSGITWFLGGPLTTFGPVNFITQQPLDAAVLLRGPPDLAVDTFVAFEGTVSGQLFPGADIAVDYDAGTVRFLRNLSPGEIVYVQYQLRSCLLEPVSGTVSFLDPLRPGLAGWSLLADYDTGLPIPYSQVYGPAHGYDTFIPANGDLVAFFGEFDYQQSYGTSLASVAAARPYGNGAVPELEVFGTAPAASVVGIGGCCSTAGPVGIFAATEDSYEFAALGYDGVPATGDEGAVLALGFGSPQAMNTGFSWEDRWLLDYSLRYPRVTTIATLGNTGPGYGSGAPPGTSPGVIAVASGTSQDYRLPFQLDGGPAWGEVPSCPPAPFDPKDCTGSGGLPGPYGDIAYFASRGPSLLGSAKPDAVAIGAYGTGALALALQCGGVTASCDGNFAVDVTSGLSAAVAAGVAALMVEAYRSAHAGADPTNIEVRAALKGGADDMHRDVLQQGAGWINALRSVDVMREQNGITASLDAWVAGGYQGTARPGFANFLLPGQADAATVVVANHNQTTAKSIQVSDSVFRVAFRFEWSFPLGTGSSQRYVLKPDGVYDATGSLVQPASFLPYWDTAEFAKVTVAYDAAAYPGATALRLDTFDWSDANGNGVLDQDLGAQFGFYERNRITVSAPGTNANAVWDTMYDLGGRIHDGLVLNPRSGAAAPVNATVVVEFYEKADWAWVSPSGTSFNIPAAGTFSLSVGASVPFGAAAGLYEGAIYLLDTVPGAVTTIPIVINVPHTAAPFVLGGNVPVTSLYENGGVVQGSRQTSWRQSGDSRFFWVLWDPGAPAPNRKMITTALLQGPRSEPEIHLYSLTPDGTWTDPARYGPGTMSLAASTGDLTGRTTTCLQPEPRVVTLEPTTPCTPTLYREFVPSDVLPGGVYAVHIRAWAARAETEPLRGDFGVLETNPITFTLTSPTLQGSEPFTAWSNSPLYEGLSAVRMASSRLFWDNVAANPDYYSSGPFEQWLCSQTPPNSQSFSVPPGTQFVTAHITSPNPSEDHDLAVFRDANANGVCDFGVDTLIGMSAGPTADETVRTSFPAPGTYLAQVGMFVPGSDIFDLEILLETVGTNPFSVTGPNQTVPADTMIAATLAWDLPPATPPGSSVVGTLFLGPGLAPFAFTQRIDVNVTYDPAQPVPPTIQSVSALPDPQEQFLAVNVSASVIGDALASVTANVTYPDGSWTNDSMLPAGGDVYYFVRPYDQIGVHSYAVTAMNASGGADTATGSFRIVPVNPGPVITNVAAVPDPGEAGATVNVTATITDADGIASARIEVRQPDNSLISGDLSDGGGDVWYHARTYALLGSYQVTITATDGNAPFPRTSVATGSFTVQDTASPIARAGPDQTVPVGTTVVFDGSASSDNTVLVNYTWEIVGLGRVYGVTASYRFAQAGTFRVILTVRDLGGNSGTDDLFVTVLDVTQPVIVNALADPNPVEAPAATVVTFTATDDVAVLDAWVEGWDPANAFMGNQTAYLGGGVFVPTSWALVPLGTYRFVISVVDPSGNRATQTLLVVAMDGIAPQISSAAGQPDPQRVGVPVTVWARMQDPYLASVRAAVRNPLGALIGNFTMVYNASAARHEASVTPTILGTYVFTVWASDTSGNVASVSGTFGCVDVTPPTFSNVAVTPTPQDIGGVVNVSARITDDLSLNTPTIAYFDPLGAPDGSSAMAYSPADGRWYHARAFASLGVYSFTIFATDGSGNGAQASGIIPVVDRTSPVIRNLTVTPARWEVGVRAVVNASPSDNVGVQRVTVQLESSGGNTVSNASMTCDAQFRACTATLVGMAADTYTVRVWANDASQNYGMAGAGFVVVAGAAPVANAGADVTIDAGGTVTFDGTGSTDDFGIVSSAWRFTYDGSPVNLTEAISSFRFDAPGTYVVTLTVVDLAGHVVSDTVTVTVRSAGGAPVELWVYGAVAAALFLALLVAALAGRAVRRRRERASREREPGTGGRDETRGEDEPVERSNDET